MTTTKQSAIAPSSDPPSSLMSMDVAPTPPTSSGSAKGAVASPAKKRAAPKATSSPKPKKVKQEPKSPAKSRAKAAKPAASATKPTKKVTKKASQSKNEQTQNGQSQNGHRQNGHAEAKPENDVSDEEDEIDRWWEAATNGEDDSVKWETLEHNGVIFPPPYEALPKTVYLLYDRKPVSLPLEAEEVAGFFGAMVNTDHAKNPVFQKNFFGDFLDVLKQAGGAKDKKTGTSVEISDFEKCDFSVIFKHYDAQREAKKAIPAAEKKRLKQEKDAAEEKYKFCLLNGKKQPVGNFRIEPPGLFRGRGEHPKTGKLKARVLPEQVTINIGENAKVPEPPAGHQWAEVRHDNKVTWLATWKENINSNVKYVFLGQNSSLKGMSDMKKFEKARELKKHVERIRRSYRTELKDKLMVNRQRATAMYLIDVLALRAGGEKGEDEADTVGCCSLRYEHITLEPPNLVTFDFLGKDSIRYFQQVEVDKLVFNNLRIFKKEPKGPGDDIFDRLDPASLNKHLQSYMPGLTAKVFRTYNASHTMQQQLDQIPEGGSVAEKLVAFNAANREVAILCNHQRTVSKGHVQSMEKIEGKVEFLEWQKYRYKKMLLQVDPETPKRLGKQYFADVKQMTKTRFKKILAAHIAEEREKAKKKYARDNEKLKVKKEGGESVELLTEKDLKDSLAAIDELNAQYKKEEETGEYVIKGKLDTEKLEAQVAKIEQRILNTRLSMKDKEDNSTVALSTSKINYIDPRLTAMFAAKHKVPIEKLFAKTLREKFQWAIHSADEKWKF